MGTVLSHIASMNFPVFFVGPQRSPCSFWGCRKSPLSFEQRDRSVGTRSRKTERHSFLILASMASKAYFGMEEEFRRRDTCAALGNVMSGCAAVDLKVMKTGFERGSIVGISAENGNTFGEVVSL